MNPRQVLIVSDDSKFVQSLTARWKEESDFPSITAVSTEVSQQASPNGYELVVVGPLRRGVPLPSPLPVSPDCLLCVVGDADGLKNIRGQRGEWLLLLENPGWMRALFCMAREVSRRHLAEARAREAEMTNLLEKRFGILGKSWLDARLGMINALTSLLGNADLLLLSEDQLPVDSREHVRTIHWMALRLNEVVQRLTSLENEFELSERKSQVETPQMRVAGSSKS